MFDYKGVSLYYFSGTGNTLMMAKEVQTFFIQKGYDTVLIEMNENAFQMQDQSILIGLIFPVAIQSTFPNVWKFVEDLPESSGQSVFMVDTMESFSGGVVGPMKKVLTHKGYSCMGACELKMATSMQTSQRKVEEGIIKYDLALQKLALFLERMIIGETEWRRIPVFSDWMRAISKKRKIWTAMSEKLEVDHEKCIDCMRCANYCPKNAFLLNQKNLIQKKIVKVDELKSIKV